MPGFLEDKTYLISPSINESFGYAIAEAMARGIIPLIRNRPGVKDLWPTGFIYNTPSDLLRIMKEVDAYSHDYLTVKQKLRTWVEKRYDRKDQLNTINQRVRQTLNLHPEHNRKLTRQLLTTV